MERMTDFTRSSRLSLRRPAATTLINRPKASTTSTAVQPIAERTRGADKTAAPPVRSDALLQGRSHVSIEHNGETYQLRATRLGKLILTK
jgi:hemin uptake protein HemP